MRQVMFEVFGVPAAYALSSPVAALYGAGRTTGVLVDVGDSGTRVSVVIGGAPLRRASRASTVGGRRVAERRRDVVEADIERRRRARGEGEPGRVVADPAREVEGQLPGPVDPAGRPSPSRRAPASRFSVRSSSRSFSRRRC